MQKTRAHATIGIENGLHSMNGKLEDNQLLFNTYNQTILTILSDCMPNRFYLIVAGVSIRVFLSIIIIFVELFLFHPQHFISWLLAWFLSIVSDLSPALVAVLPTAVWEYLYLVEPDPHASIWRNSANKPVTRYMSWMSPTG